MTNVRRRYMSSPSAAGAGLRMTGFATGEELIQVEGIGVLGEDKQRLQPPNHWDWSIEGNNFTQGWKIGKLAFIGGQISADNKAKAVGKDDIAAQTRNVFEFIRRTLAEGGLDESDVAKLYIYYYGGEDWAEVERSRQIIADIQAEFYGKPGPAVTAVRVTGFAFEDLLIEIEAMAVTRDSCGPDSRGWRLPPVFPRRDSAGRGCGMDLWFWSAHSSSEVLRNDASAMPPCDPSCPRGRRRRPARRRAVGADGRRDRRKGGKRGSAGRSAAIPISNHSQRAASSIASSVTSTISSTLRLTISKMRSSVRWHDIVGTFEVTSASVTVWPASMLAFSVGEPVGSTPMMRHAGRPRADRGREPGDQAAAADRDDDHVHLRQVLEDLEAERALARDHQRVGEGMDIGGVVSRRRRRAPPRWPRPKTSPTIRTSALHAFILTTLAGDTPLGTKIVAGTPAT